MDGSLEGVKYYIRGYGDKDRPDDLMAFYAEKLGNVAVSMTLGERETYRGMLTDNMHLLIETY